MSRLVTQNDLPINLTGNLGGLEIITFAEFRMAVIQQILGVETQLPIGGGLPTDAQIQPSIGRNVHLTELIHIIQLGI